MTEERATGAIPDFHGPAVTEWRPPPLSIQSRVRRDLMNRETFGRRKYGTALFEHNGRNALQDAYEEALDLACYLKQALIEQDAK